MVELLGIPCGVVINRSAENDQETLDYCQSKNLPVLARFPDDRKAAEAYSRGELVTRTLCSFERPFTQLLDDLLSSDGPTRFFHQRCQS
jgi:MinD superfamily P-loop ATPase